MNNINIIGNLTRDCELKVIQSGKSVSNFTLAVADRFNKENTYFIDVVTWGKLAELCAEYLKKGNKAGVSGRLTTRTYENQSGQKVKVTEIVAEDVTFLTPKNGQAAASGTKDPWEDLGKRPTLEIDPDDENEIPF